MKRLNRSTVPNLERHPVKVLQFGSGNFLRGFADVIIDKMNEAGKFKGNVVIVQSISSSTNSGIHLQDGLYHVAERGVVGNALHEQLRLVSCVSGAFSASEAPADFFSASVNPDLRFVISNTTEAGIVFKEEPFRDNAIPETFPGKLTVILLQRFRNSLPGLVILPCELIDKNGGVLRERILEYVRHWKLPLDFERWVTDQCIFCNTLVDRIVPGCSKSLVDEVATQTGYLDEIPVSVEPYYFWAIEAPPVVKEEFPADVCGLNVHFVNDLSYFRERKVRILNGGHTALMPVAYLQGLRTVKECLSDEGMKSFLSSVLFDEIIPTLNGDLHDLRTFAHEVLDRFANPFVEHQLSSIALNSIAKFKVRLLPTIIEYHRVKGEFPKLLIRSFAALIIFYRGRWREQVIPVKDDASVIRFFAEVWQGSQSNVANRVLSNPSFWGTDLTQIRGFDAALANEIDVLLFTE